MQKPIIEHDLQAVDDRGRLIFHRLGKLVPKEGLIVEVRSSDEDDEGNPDDLVVNAVLARDESSGGWVGEIDWRARRHESGAPSSLSPKRAMKLNALQE